MDVKTAEQEIWALEAKLGGLSASVRCYDNLLLGLKPIGRYSMAVANYEGRDYVAELIARRRKCVLERIELAQELRNRGRRVKGLDRYRATPVLLERISPILP